MKKYPELNWTFSTLGCPEATLEEAVALARENRLERLELRTLEDRVDLPALFRARFGEPSALRDYLEDQAVKVTALDSSLKLVGNTEEDRKAFLEFAEWAEAIDCPSLRVFDGGTFSPELSQKDGDEARETIAWWREKKIESDWKTDIIIETHDCLTASHAVEQLQESLEEPVGILWDTHHTWKKAGEQPGATWEVLKPYVRHVHIKDSVDRPSARHPFTYVQLGEGDFDLDGTLSMLKEEGFDKVVSIEWERKWHPYLPPMEEALKRAQKLDWW